MAITVEFRTDIFPAYENEEGESVNGFIGRRCVEWVRDGLPRYGQETLSICPEDWGWLVFLEETFPFWIGCNNMGCGDDGLPEYHLIIVAEPRNRLFRKKINTRPAMDKAVMALHELISNEPKILNPRWG